MLCSSDVYTFLSDLKPGGLASVQLAHDSTHHPLVLKLYPNSKLHTANFTVEVAALGRLFHPNIVSMRDYRDDWTSISKYGVPRTGGLIVLEYCQYGDFFELVSRTGRMEEGLARVYFAQLLDAVENCHTHNILHRDLKPENLLIDSECRLKVADFGSARIPNSRPLELFGTQGYLPPNPSMEANSPSLDLFSCGVILYFLLTRELPFAKADPLNARYNHFLHNKPGFWSSKYYLGPEAKSLIDGLLTADPHARLTLLQARYHPWMQGESLSWPQAREKMLLRFSRLQS